MCIYLMMPARLNGWLDYNEKAENNWEAPWISWYLEPLPMSEQNTCKIEKGIENDIINQSDTKFFELLTEKVSANRTFHKSFIEVTHRSEECFYSKNGTPVIDMVYKWLREDLKRIGWLKR